MREHNSLASSLCKLCLWGPLNHISNCHPQPSVPLHQPHRAFWASAIAPLCLQSPNSLSLPFLSRLTTTQILSTKWSLRRMKVTQQPLTHGWTHAWKNTLLTRFLMENALHLRSNPSYYLINPHLKNNPVWTEHADMYPKVICGFGLHSISFSGFF